MVVSICGKVVCICAPLINCAQDAGLSANAPSRRVRTAFAERLIISHLVI